MKYLLLRTFSACVLKSILQDSFCIKHLWTSASGICSLFPRTRSTTKNLQWCMVFNCWCYMVNFMPNDLTHFVPMAEVSTGGVLCKKCFLTNEGLQFYLYSNTGVSLWVFWTFYGKCFLNNTSGGCFLHWSHSLKNFSLFCNKKKQPYIGVFRKRCCENMQETYKTTPMPKCDFNKVAKQLYGNHTSPRAFYCKFAAPFPMDGCFWTNAVGCCISLKWRGHSEESG